MENYVFYEPLRKLKETVESPAFTDKRNKLSVALGADVSGHPVIGDLADPESYRGAAEAQDGYVHAAFDSADAVASWMRGGKYVYSAVDEVTTPELVATSGS